MHAYFERDLADVDATKGAGRFVYDHHNRSRGIDTIEDACVLFALVCCIVVLVCVLSFVIVSLRNYLIRRHCRDESTCKYEPATVESAQCDSSLTLVYRDSHCCCLPAAHLKEPFHGVTHLAVIMDGNRRYGKLTSAGAAGGSGKSCLTEDIARLQEIAEVCDAVCGSVDEGEEYDGDGEAGASGTYKERLHRHYSNLLSLIQLSPLNGHRQGGEKLMEFISFCTDARVSMLTVYAFSTENWARPVYEVKILMALFFFFFERIRSTAHEKGIFIRFVSSEPERLPPRMCALMKEVEAETRRITPRRITVNVCVSYSGQSEIVAACNRLLRSRLALNGCGHSSKDIGTQEFELEMLRSLTQADDDPNDTGAFNKQVPREPQLVLRTSGENRLSNFLLFEAAYSEFAFTNKMWPEFTEQDLSDALHEYSQRTRRRGR